MNKIECPYCGNEFKPSGDSYDQEEEREEECPECGKHFMVQCTYWASYNAYKIGQEINQGETL